MKTIFSRGIEWTDGYDGSRVKALLTHIRLSWRWKRVYLLHCWAGGLDDEYRSYTCMRAAGHFGMHEPTPNGEIGITFGEPA